MDDPPLTRAQAAARFRAAAGKRPLWTVALILGPTVAFFALFAWDHEHTYGHESSGPYSAWQVVLLLIVLLGLIVGSARQGMPVLPVVIIPAVLTFWFAQDWSKTDESGLYGVGVVMLAVGSLIGVAVAARFARSYFAPPDQHR